MFSYMSHCSINHIIECLRVNNLNSVPGKDRNNPGTTVPIRVMWPTQYATGGITPTVIKL